MDANWAGDPETRKSVTGYVFTFAGGAISWFTKRQSVTAQSSAEAEYIAYGQAATEAKSLFQTLQQIFPRFSTISLFVDNQSAQFIAETPTYSTKTRHFELKWHFIRDCIKDNIIKLYKISGQDNAADMLTKPVCRAKLVSFIFVFMIL